MENQQLWLGGCRYPKYHQLLAVIATVWCVRSCIIVSDAATSFGSISGSEGGGEKKKLSKVVVQGVVYCEATSQNQLLKDAEVEVECNNRGVKETEVGRTTAGGAFSVTLQDYDYEALGGNGCMAKLKSSLHTTCTIPTNRGGGLTGTDLVFKEKSKDMVILTAGPFAFQQSKVKATRAVSRKNLLSNTDDKYSSGSSLPAVSGLWYTPPENDHYTSPSPAHYEFPNHRENRGDHESHEDNHRRSEHEGRQGSSGEGTAHKARDKDCSPRSGSHHYKTPPHHSVPNYEKSPPTYHSEHHNIPPRHESSSSYPPPLPHYDAPPYVPYVHHASLPPYDGYKSSPPKQYDPPPYYQRGNVDTTAKAASAQPKESSP